jgi:lipoprotein signal peptidase
VWNWHLTHNTGAAFSFLANAGGWQHGFFIALATLISVVLAVALRKVAREDWRNAFPFALIIAGALGNLVDRLRFGYVVDFVEWYAGGFYWPVFNLADSCIVVGRVLMVFYSIRLREPVPDGDRAGQPARILRRRRPRDRDRQARDRDAGRADLRAPRGGPQPLRGRGPAPARRRFSSRN